MLQKAYYLVIYTYMKKLFKPTIIFLILIVLGFIGYNILKPAPTGVALPQAVAVFETSLQSPITSTATTMTLTANSIRGGGSLSGYNCFSIDEGSSNAETICGTVSGTTVTGLSRGISQATGTTTVAALQFSHRRGSNVKITDFPIIQRLKAQNNGEDTFANILLYDVPKTFSTSTSLVDKNYVDNLSNQGAATSSEAVAGISELATQIEMASSTDNGINNPLVLQAKYATSSPQTAGLWSVITNNAGKIAQGFIDLTQNYTWSGLHTFSNGFISTASSTLTAQVTFTGVVTGAESSMFGAGSDGDIIITSNTSLLRDMYYDNLTINTGVTLNSNGFRIFIKNTLNTVGTGKIASNGNNGGNGGNGTGSGGIAGIAATQAYTTGTLPVPLTGATGGTGGIDSSTGTAGTAGTALAKALTLENSVAGGTGGTGGGGIAGGTGGAGAATTTAMFTPPNALFTAIYNLFDLVAGTVIQYGIAPSSGGGGGGGGGTGGSCPTCSGGGGGGSGSSGGVVWIAAKTITNLTTEAKGGVGGQGGNDNSVSGGGGVGGGGAGGNGGTIILIYSKSTTISTDVTGGAGGAIGNSGETTNATTGTVGNIGKVYQITF